jgi:hypothetical protein
VRKIWGVGFGFRDEVLPGSGFSWHRLLRRTLVRPVFMASFRRDDARGLINSDS